jgi:hypothetical protein
VGWVLIRTTLKRARLGRERRKRKRIPGALKWTAIPGAYSLHEQS